MDDTPSPSEPANLVLLRRLVTVLTAVMIVGVVTVVGLLVIRLQGSAPPLPQTVTLPDGAQAQSVTYGTDWYAVVTQDKRILIFDRVTGALTQTVEIAPSGQ